MMLPLATRQPHKLMYRQGLLEAANGSYTEVVSSIGPILITDLYKDHDTSNYTDHTFYLAKGAAGSEVNILTLVERGDERAGGLVPTRLIIPASTRIAIKCDSQPDCRAELGYYDLPLWRDDAIDQLVRRHEGSWYANSARASVGVSSPWAYGSWVEFVSAAPYDLLLTSFQANWGSTQSMFEIGVGAASSEVGIGEFEALQLGANTTSDYLPFPIPIFVRAGERVAVRGAKASGVSANYATLTYWELRDNA